MEHTFTSTAKKGLGKGLSALIAAAPPPSDGRDPRATLEVAVERITPSPFQPRRTFDEAKLEGAVVALPTRGDVTFEVQEQLIVELMSK